MRSGDGAESEAAKGLLVFLHEDAHGPYRGTAAGDGFLRARVVWGGFLPVCLRLVFVGAVRFGGRVRGHKWSAEEDVCCVVDHG